MCTINQDHMMYGYWDIKCKGQSFFVTFWTILVLPFDPTNNPKNQNFEKIKKTPGDIILHLCTTNHDHMMYGSWDIKHNRQTFWYFKLFFALLPPWQLGKSKFWKNEKNSWRYCHFKHENHTWKSYDVWFLRYGARQSFFSFWIIFCPFTPLPPPLPNNPVNQNFEKTPGGIIILHKCTINDNHMMHGFQDMNCTRPNVFVILGHFLPFYAPPPPPCLTAPKNEKFKKNEKNPGEIII